VYFKCNTFLHCKIITLYRLSMGIVFKRDDMSTLLSKVCVIANKKHTKVKVAIEARGAFNASL